MLPHRFELFLGSPSPPRRSSIEALRIFHAQPERFDLVITDMTMPKMTGIDLSRDMLKIRPDIPIILCTGFSEKIGPEKSQAMGIRQVLAKPVLIRDLTEAIRKALDSGETEAL